MWHHCRNAADVTPLAVQLEGGTAKKIAIERDRAADDWLASAPPIITARDAWQQPIDETRSPYAGASTAAQHLSGAAQT